MSDFITMTCKSCGGKLKITPEIDDFACMYCGTEFRVRREGGNIALSPLVDEMKKVSVSTDKTASELAIIRLKDEIENSKKQLNQDREMFGKKHDEIELEITTAQDRSKSWKIATVFIIFILLLILLTLLFTELLQLSELWPLMISIVLTLPIS